MRVGLCGILLSLLISGCGFDLAVESHVQDVNRSSWWQSKGFTFNIVDTLSKYDLSIYLRHERGVIEGDTLGFRVDYRTPKGYFSRDTLMILVDSIYGRIGSGYRISSAKYIIAERFEESGEYEIRLTPVESYNHCLAVGIELKESN
ncbi:MAG: hypothetical protein SNH88_01645 [Rikenellaceae bacterium]